MNSLSVKKSAVVFLFLAGILGTVAALADCEDEWNRLQQADVGLHRAEANFAAAKQAYQQAQANLNAAVAGLNAVGAKLGLTGQATAGSVTFGRSPSGETFFDNAEYRAAKAAWQDAKAANEGAEGEMDAAGAERQKAQDEYDAAKKAYEECKKRARDRKLGDEGLLLGPEPLKLDETLDLKVKEITEPQVIYVSKPERDFNVDYAFVLTPLGNKQVQLDVSVLARGRGADFRKWIPESPELLTPSKERILPVSTSKTYVSKPSPAAPVAPLLFAAIGSQYKPYADRAAASPGTPCSTGGAQGHSGSYGKAINRTGMAAGLGLLSAQSGGELEGQRSTFILNDVPLLGTLFRSSVRNTGKKELVTIITPIIIHPTGD